MSGVVFGLFGYIWMKSRFEASSGYFMHPQTVVLMLLWLYLAALAGTFLRHLQMLDHR